MDYQTADNIKDLQTYLNRFGQRYRLCDGWTLLQQTLWIALLAAALIQLVGRYWPIPYLGLWTVAPLGLWLIAVPLWSMLKPSSSADVARRLDSDLDLKERTGTALYLHNCSTEFGNEKAALVALQQQDALDMLQSIRPQEALPLLWKQRALMGAGAVLVGLAILLYLPNPMDQLLAARAAVAEAVTEAAEAIDDLQEDVAESDTLPPNEKEKLLDELNSLAVDLRADPRDQEEALARLSEVEEQLRRQLDENRFAQQQMLETLAAQLQALSQSESGSSESGLDEMLDALAQLAETLDELDAEEQRDLAEALAQLAANAAQAGDGSLAQTLAAMGQAAGVGNADAMAQAASSAAQLLADSALVAAQQGELQEALDRLQQSSDGIAQAGQRDGQAVAQVQGQGNGQGNGQGQNSGQGRGGNSAGSGGGTNAGQLPAAQRTGQGQLLDGGDRGSMMGDLGEQVYVPWERRPASDEQSFIAGQETGQGETQIQQQQNPLPGLDSSTLIPYQEVYADYVESANQAIERSTIPPGLKDYVRDYFIQLEP